MNRPLVLMFALCLFACAAFGQTQITVDPATCVIVVPEGSDDIVRTAADELQRHLQLITGEDIAVVDESSSRGAYRFYVGVRASGDDRPFAPEEARWVIGDNIAYLYGDDSRGSFATQFAVYAFLEEQLGVRWIMPGDEGIAYETQSPLRLTAGSFNWIPELMSRKIRTYARPGQYPVIKDYVAEFEAFLPTHEQHDQTARDVRQWQLRMRMGGHGSLGYGHTFTGWWDKYHEEHPDYFALNRWGKREPELRVNPGDDTPQWTVKDKQSVKVCVSNPAVAEQIVRNWVERGMRTPWVNACMNDQVWGFCRCPDCLALDGRVEGEELGDYLKGLTDRYVYLANAVARLAKQHDPNAGATMYAYETSEQPPKQIRVEPNVLVAIVPTTIDLAKLVRLYGHWGRMGAKTFFMRPNFPLYYNVLALPVGVEKQMFDAFQVAYGYGALGADYDSLTATWPYSGICHYILAHEFQDPTKPFEYWVDHYCAAYGPAAEDVKAYHAYWRYELWDKRLGPDLNAIVERGKSHNFARGLMWSLGDYYRDTDFDATDAILERAAGRDLNPRQREMVDRLILANQQARLLVKAVTTPGIDKFEHAQQLVDFRMAHRDQRWFGWFFDFAIESRFGDSTGAKTAIQLKDYPLPWIATGLAWRFKIDDQDVGLDQNWEVLTYEQTEDWDQLRTDFFWDNPYDSDTDPDLMARLKGYDGIGWYQTRMHIPGEMKGREIYLRFGAVDESCWIWVNGEKAGEHLFINSDDWTTPFEIRIDELIDWDKSFQVFTVRVEDKSGSGGIWKRVWLVSKFKGE